MLNPMRLRAAQRTRGLSLVETMVGIAIGLIVVAGATLVVATQLGDNRRLLLETQVQQDLRAAADIVTRDIRRSGAWLDSARLGIWTPGAAPQSNPYSAMLPTSASATEVTYKYLRTAGSSTTDYGFRLQSGVIQTLLGGWQDLTDARVVRITQFEITPHLAPPVKVPCPNDCPGPGTADACWPAVTVRDVVVDITGVSVADPSVQRNLSTTVRLRNDEVTGACP